MTKSQLKVLNKDELLNEGKKLGLKALAGLRKDQLVDRIAEALEKTAAACVNACPTGAMAFKNQEERL